MPEVARTYGGHRVQPQLPAGLQPVDRCYNIKIDNAIGAVDIQTQIRECTSSGGTSPFCANITRPLGNTNTSAANFPTRYFNGSINAAMTKTQGVDLEASYRTPLAFHEDSSLGIRVLGSYQPNLEIQNFPGAVTFDYAGRRRALLEMAHHHRSHPEGRRARCRHPQPLEERGEVECRSVADLSRSEARRL